LLKKRKCRHVFFVLVDFKDSRFYASFIKCLVVCFIPLGQPKWYVQAKFIKLLKDLLTNAKNNASNAITSIYSIR